MGRDVSISAVKTSARCYCRPLSSNPLFHFPQWKLHLSPPRLSALALACCSFMFTHKHNPPQSDSVCRQHVVRLPRGLESCRYGGTVGVTFSELGPDSNGDRSSMPSEAMSLTVTDDGQRRRERLLAAPSLQSARRSSRRWFAGAVLLPVQQPR